ncbi:MAG: glycosyltransferase N-terminal domain-containing protein [Chthoniobacteraceae bacterium]
MALLLYRLLFPFAFLVALPFYALRLVRRERGRASQQKPPGYGLGLGQRFGSYDAKIRTRLAEQPAPVWICSISVGETLVALKIARAIRAKDPQARIVLSVTTSTGYELLLREAAALDWLVPLYNPIDFAFAARAAISAIQPRVLVLTEGGIWPNLLSTARTAGIRIVLAGARLSARSERRWQRFGGIARIVWDFFDTVCVPEAEDVARFEGIGVARGRIRHTGSVKFDNAAKDTLSREAEFRALVQPLGFFGPLIVGGSTWDPEEQALAGTLKKLRAEFPTLRLILVPRHVERSAAICDDLTRAGLRVALRSKLPTAGEADVLLVDTTGELRHWYVLATVVFVGKSLPGISEIGGQNAGEPAALGRPVVFGPHMENFAPLVAHLLKDSAAVQIATASELPAAIRTLLGDAETCTAIGTRARNALEIHQGATARTAECILG